MNLISEEKENAIRKIFNKDKVVIGMIHAKPLPGSPRYRGESMEEIIKFSKRDAIILKECGVDGLMFENHGDLPFLKPDDIGYETVAALTRIAVEVINEVKLPFGFNFLANGTIQSFASAKATGASWIRCNQWVNAYVANEGIVEGASAKALRYKSFIKADDVKVMADVHVKHGSHSIVADRTIEEQTKDNIFFDVDILIVTGNRTGDEASIKELLEIKKGHNLPIIVGSGMTIENVRKIFPYVSGIIVGSYLKEGGVWWNPIDKDRTMNFMNVVKSIRGY